MDVEAEHSRLRQDAHHGWGGESYQRRLAGWKGTVDQLLQDSRFPRPPAHILELGSGNGMVSSLFAQQGYRVQGVELSQEAVEWARDRFASAGLAGSFHQGDVCSMPYFDDNTFDAVIDGNCLHCVIGEDRSRCLAEVKRVLRAGGIFVVSTMCGEPKSEEARAQFDPQARLLMAEGRPYRTLISVEALKDELGQAGFQELSSRVSTNPWWDHLTMVTRMVG
jgi:ubiquinone/menaquinone biosynthesis C-methylase UbiE